MKRIILFAVTNIAVLLVLSVFARVFGLDVYLAERGGSLPSLLWLSAIFGFGGAFLSLALSKSMAKITMGVKVISEPRTTSEARLLETVRAHAQRAAIGMPEVGVFNSNAPNAFATGASRDRALVAVSTGLVAGMKSEEVEAVLGHEISHIANGDMVTMALLQGVLNTFVIVLSRVLGRIIDSYIGGNREGEGVGFGYYIIVFVLDMVFGLFASMIAMWFSRHREFRADAGGATLAGRDKMVAALERLSLTYGQNTLPKQVAAFGISGGVGHGLRRLLMTHPPLEERIQALRNAQPDASAVRQGVVA